MNSELLEAAKQAMANAYARYSGFHVGAAILAENGKIYSGCNVENAAYPIGNCAEASAIAAMVRDGAREIREIAIIGGKQGRASAACMPCGGCRQRILEFAVDSTQIHIFTAAGLHRTYACKELLPDSFGPKDVAG
ncbi:MAG TPA: cytidine deaminase [Dongiaceae bacterium]|nr:cytidine deaminase [Dongiaceae bacterium]